MANVLFYCKAAPAGNDVDTSLLLHGDESPLVDSSLNNHPVTTNGSISRSAAQSKFGGYSIYSDGSSGNYLSVTDHADFDLGSGDFTIDFWAYVIDTNDYYFVMSKTPSSGYGAIGITVKNTGHMTFWFGQSSGSWTQAVEATLTTGQWQHWACVRESGMLYLYRDGTSATTPVSANFALDTTAQDLWIGRQNWAANPYWFKGYLDEIRISKGVARWSSDFTPPTQAYS